MAKKRKTKKVKSKKTKISSEVKKVMPKKVVKTAIDLEKELLEEKNKLSLFFLKFVRKYFPHKSKYRKKEEEDLKRVGWGISDLIVERRMEKTTKSEVPTWFYIASIFAAFLFVVYISIFATIHFGSIEYMNITIVFLFIVMVSFFLISTIYFISEKNELHAIAPILFFIGIASIMIYAFNAVDTSDLVRYSIIYTIIVAAISTYILAIRR